MGHRHVLVTGPGGSGKTTLAHYFQSVGENAFDADLAGIGFWSDGLNNERKVPNELEMSAINAWAEENGLSWYWDSIKLKELLLKADKVYLMGSAENAYDLSHLFDEVYFLDTDEDLILKRLKHRAENNETYHDNGRNDAQQRLILKNMKRRKESARRMGFRFVDSSLSPEELFKVIANP